MRVKWVLIGFGVAYALAALSFVPLGKFLPAPLNEAWELFSEMIFTLITIVSIGLLEVASFLGGPLSRATGIGPADANEGLLALLCIGVAIYSVVHLLRKETTPGRRGIHAFFLLLALTIVVMVRSTMMAWAHFV